MQTSKQLSTLRYQLRVTERQADALRDAIEALETYQKVSRNGRSPTPPTGAKTAKTTEPKARVQRPKTCPECGIEAANGAGLSAHRRAKHPQVLGPGISPSS